MVRDYTQALVSGGLAGTRIGVPRKGLFGGNSHADRLVDAALATLKTLGAEIVDPVELTMPDDLGKNEFEVLLYEFKADLERLPRRPRSGRAREVAEGSHRVQRGEQGSRDAVLRPGDLPARPRQRARSRRRATSRPLGRNKQATRDHGIDAVMIKHRLDALVAPTSGPPSLTDLVNGDYGPNGASTHPGHRGLPARHRAGGLRLRPAASGSPSSAARWSELTLIRIAYAYEQATKHRAAPRFLPSAPI